MKRFFGNGIPAGQSRFLYSGEIFADTPTSETENTKAKIKANASHKYKVVCSNPPGSGEEVTVVAVVNGSEVPVSTQIQGSDRGGFGSFANLANDGSTVSFKATLSAGSADVGNINVYMQRNDKPA